MQNSHAPHAMDARQIYAAFSTRQAGISPEEALERAIEYGHNVLEAGHKRTDFSRSFWGNSKT